MTPATELNDAQWRRRLREYCLLGDRDVEPVFVGRHALFARVAAMIEKVKLQPGSTTIVIGGAPGAGKSAFIAEAMRRYGDMEAAVPIQLQGDLLGPAAFVTALGKVFGKAPAERMTRSQALSTEANALVAKGGVSHAVETEVPSDTVKAEREGMVPWHTIRDLYGEELAGRPILLFVDEMQTFTQHGDIHHDRIPFALHEGPPDGCVSIVPVYAGLADTQAVLNEQAGITRLDGANILTLGGLEPQESREYVRDMLVDYLGAQGRLGAVTALVDWMVAGGDHWPQHLRVQVAAVAEGLLAADSRDLADLDTDAVCRHIEASRNLYYQSRHGNVFRGRYRDATRAVVQEAAERDGGEGVALAETADIHLANTSKYAPNGMDFVEAMTHAGMLQKKPGSDRYHCPIPSMRRWFETGHHSVARPGL